MCDKKAVISDPYAPYAKQLNARSVMVMQAIGRGQTSPQSFCGLMDILPPVVAHSYKQHNKQLAQHSMEVAASNMLAASAHLHHLHGAKSTDIIDIAVSCDGTWSKRGFTVTHGVVAVIAWETGQVLDFEIKSKRCSVCAMKMEVLDEGSNEFAEWWESHQTHCECNHAGSSPAMEMSAAGDLFQRSENRLYLRYTEVISDGDTKTVSNLNAVLSRAGRM